MAPAGNALACFAVFLPGLFAFAGKVCADTHRAASASYDDVSAAVSAASRGDIVEVPAGSEPWGAALEITKGLSVRGAGIDQTYAGNAISYIPDSTARESNERFELSGFTLQGSLYLENATTAIVSNIKIHDNKFENVTGRAILVRGTIYGAIYSNQFDGIGQPIGVFGLDQDSWAAFSGELAYGAADNLYFEDNTLGFSTPFTGDPGWIETGQGGRIVVRYNTWDDANTSGGEYWDVHGLQTPPACEQYSTMIVEFYGNIRINNNGSYRWQNLRGSRLLQFNNTVAGTGSAPGIQYSEYSCDECACCGVYAQHINDTYVWNNAYNGSIVDMTQNFDDCTTYTITENRDYFNYDASCTAESCAAGIGCGPSAPAGTCAAGVGYWVTSASPCTTPPATMEEMKTVTQAGRFYRCTSTDTWTLYFSPYAYPHPLRTDTPSAPTGLRIVSP